MFVVQWQPTPQLLRADLDGMNAAPVPNLSGFALTQVAVDAKNNKLYFGDGSNQIKRANLDGTGVEVLWSGMAQTAARIYFTEVNAQQVRRVGVNGANNELLIPGVGYGVSIDLTCALSQ